MFIIMFKDGAYSVYNTTTSECMATNLSYVDAWDLKYTLDDKHYFKAYEQWEIEGGDKPEHDSSIFPAL